MEASRRRVKRAQKRHQQQVRKHELKIRIQKILKEFRESLPQRLLLSVLVGGVVEESRTSNVEPNSSSKKHHQKLSLLERQQIYLWRSLDYSIRSIARLLFRAPSTISRELKRNRPEGSGLHGLCSYSRAKQAHDKALDRRRKSRIRVRFGSVRTQGLVHEAISSGLSPVLASGRLFLEHGIKLSYEAIYQWIYSVERVLIKRLPREGKGYKRGGKKRSRAKASRRTPRLSIEKRPEAANKRLEFGHWEVDCIVSKQSNVCLLVLQERVSRFFFVVKLPRCRAKEASQAIVKLLEPFERDWLKSLTCDNGSEFCDDHVVSLALEIPVYFCHPYCSQERGGVENRNGALRKFFPKKTDFAEVLDEELEVVYEKLINRPMQCLDFLTPKEVMTGQFEPLFKRAA